MTSWTWHESNRQWRHVSGACVEEWEQFTADGRSVRWAAFDPTGAVVREGERFKLFETADEAMDAVAQRRVH